MTIVLLSALSPTALAQRVVNGVVDAKARPRRLEQRQPATMKLFREYCSRLGKDQLTNGSCVALAEGFSRAVKAAVKNGTNKDIDASKIRIGLMAAPPEPRMFYPSCMIVPDARRVSQTRPGEKVSWIWHAFAIVDGVVYDPMYKPGVDRIGTYVKKMWSGYVDGKADAKSQPWVYCVAPEDLPRLQGRSTMGKPRMMEYREISLSDLIKNEQHLSQPR